MVRMPEVGDPARARGLSRLRLRLSETQPDLIARAQSAVTTLLRGLADGAVAAGRVPAADPEPATFVLVSLNTPFITAETLGGDAGMRRPDAVEMIAFGLRGLGATVDDAWLRDVESRLVFPMPRAARPRSARSADERRR
jgi:hypothetical protein